MFWWCVFQCLVAVVLLSRRVPGVSGCLGESGLVWACSGVVGACVGVAWLLVSGASGVAWACSGVLVWPGVGVLFSGVVCVVWFRMLMRAPLSVFFVLLSWFCLFVWLITLSGRVGLVWCVLV